MRYEDTRRLRGAGIALMRLALWIRPLFRPSVPVIRDLGALSDHERRDIGLPEPRRYMDWRSLHDLR